MQYAPQPRGPLGHVKRTAGHMTALPRLRTPHPGGEALSPLPLRIIGTSCNDRHFVAACREPRSHLTGVFAYAREFRREIEPDDEKTHVRNLAVLRGPRGLALNRRSVRIRSRAPSSAGS